MSLTKAEAAELKRLADRYRNEEIGYAERPKKQLHTYIDSLTQTTPELTDAEIVFALCSKNIAMVSDKQLEDIRSVIAAHEAKRSKQ